MTTLTKPKKINLEETNVSGLGSEIDKKCRLEAGQTEAAWKNVGEKVGLKVWRIEQFKVVAWPETEYGRFFNGDSYIVLNTYKKPDAPKLYHDIHFWLGLDTSQDEAGTAAYKTVELDDFLGTLPVQHREVEGHESSLFKSYFPFFQISKGGVESGFKSVKPEEYKPRLLHIHVNKTGGKISGLYIKEVPITFKSLNSGDVFVYDGGVTILQWNGSKANGQEKIKSAEFGMRVKAGRNGKAKIEVFDEGQDDKKFFEAIGGAGPIAPPIVDAPVPVHENKLLRLSDSSGKITFKQEAKGNLAKSLLDTNDVFILDAGEKGIFVWVGKKTSKGEMAKAMDFAVTYLKDQKLPIDSCITRILEGGESQDFSSIVQ